jgi:hypothetical protein
LKHAIDRMAAMYYEGALEAVLPSGLQYQESSVGLHQLSDAVNGQLPEAFIWPRPHVISLPGSESSPSKTPSRPPRRTRKSNSTAAYRPHHPVPEDETIRN